MIFDIFIGQFDYFRLGLQRYLMNICILILLYAIFGFELLEGCDTCARLWKFNAFSKSRKIQGTLFDKRS